MEIIHSPWLGDLSDRKTREANAAEVGMSIGKYEKTLIGIGVDFNKPYIEPPYLNQDDWLDIFY